MTVGKPFFAGSEFARFLIESEELVEISEKDPLPGDVVIYLNDEGVPKHAAKIVSKDMRLKSKWGGGLFLQHGLWEVPKSYGNTVRFFREIPPERAENAFLDFVKSRDGFDKFIDAHGLRALFSSAASG